MVKKTYALSLKDAAQVFALLSDEARLRLAVLLAQKGQLYTSELCRGVAMSQPAVSYHLGLLRRGGLVEVRREGKHNYYRLSAPLVGELLRLVCDQGVVECPE